MSELAQQRTQLATLVELYRCMRTARAVDALEQDFARRGEAFFHVSGAGHEPAAALWPHLIEQDWLQAHYRDKALLLARGVTPETLFLALFAKDASESRGRAMNAIMSAADHRVMGMPGAVGSGGLHACGVAETIKGDPARPIVYCSVGDGTTQQGEMLEAILTSAARELPVLWVVQDNSLAISTHTRGRTFFSLPSGDQDRFCGIPIQRIDGHDVIGACERYGEIVAEMRRTRRPAIVVLQVERLDSHSNADDQTLYRTPREIEEARRSRDPLVLFEAALVAQGVERSTLERIAAEATEQIRKDAAAAQRSPDPFATFHAKKELPRDLEDARREHRGDSSEPRLTMLEAVRELFRRRMGRDKRIVMFGEDVEDPKGDVFGITRGLTEAYPGRVRNSPLSESTIVGFAVGEALAGRRPIAFLQFADFLPLAFNQITTELATMYWRTDGHFQAPVIVMATTGGYKPGLGPFHASSMESYAVHTPGLDVFEPSTAADAVGLLNAALASGRPTVFFYPKNLLNDRENTTSSDVERQLVPIGKARVVEKGDDITLVGWGNAVPMCRKAAAALRGAGYRAEVIDLRSLSPWDEETVLASAERTGRLLIVHEENITCGFGAEIAAVVAQKARVPVLARRVARPDTFVPFNFANQLEVLPSYKRTLEEAAAMLGAEVAWQAPPKAESGVFVVEAIGSSPSDESVTVLDWQVRAGDRVHAGMIIANLEADKAVQELSSPVEGEVLEILVPAGEMVKVGAPLSRIRTAEALDASLKPVSREEPGTPVITKTKAPSAPASRPAAAEAPAAAAAPALEIGLAGIAVATGSRKVSNEEIAAKCPEWTPSEIVKRVGIESRYWVGEGETVVTLGAKAAHQLLAAHGISIRDIDLLITTTGTPTTTTPSTAALILHALSEGADDVYVQAHDINAACSGYLYGLQAAYDYLYTRPDKRVLLVTSETLSLRTNPADPSTAPIFGDAATATLVVAAGGAHKIRARLWPPALSAKGEDGTILRVPHQRDDFIYMDGPKVFVEAIKGMIMMLEQACALSGRTLKDLSLVVPHQANQRIINAITLKLKAHKDFLYSNIREYGNTSSSTIPICLEKLLGERKSGEVLGLTAFGGGFTFGGAVIQIV